MLAHYLQGTDLRRLHALRAARGLVLAALAFGQGLEAAALDFLEVGEEVFTTFTRGDEAKTLGVVEPLHGTGRDIAHCLFPLTIARARRPQGCRPSRKKLSEIRARQKLRETALN